MVSNMEDIMAMISKESHIPADKQKKIIEALEAVKAAHQEPV